MVRGGMLSIAQRSIGSYTYLLYVIPIFISVYYVYTINYIMRNYRLQSTVLVALSILFAMILSLLLQLHPCAYDY